jgi:hypothetical protein
MNYHKLGARSELKRRAHAKPDSGRKQGHLDQTAQTRPQTDQKTSNDTRRGIVTMFAPDSTICTGSQQLPQLGND